MRIKKKFVMLEARLIDVTHEFSKAEKKLLEMLYSRYGITEHFDMWGAASELIEDFGLDYETAYSVVKSFMIYRRELFSEYRPIRIQTPQNVLFFEHLSSLCDDFAIVNKEKYDVNIKFRGDVGTEALENRPVNLSTAYNGFYMYAPISVFDLETPSGRIWLMRDDNWKARGISIDVRFYYLKENGEHVESNVYSWSLPEGLDEDFFFVKVSYRNLYHNWSDETKKYDFMSFKVPFPKPLNKESAFSTFDLIINDVLEKVSNTEFELPEGVTPYDTTI